MNGTVSKTVVAPVATVGSNPTLSANCEMKSFGARGARLRQMFVAEISTPSKSSVPVMARTAAALGVPREDLVERKDMQKTTTFLMFVGDQAGKAEEAMRLYTSLFKNSEIKSIQKYESDEPGGKKGMVRHATFTIAGQEYMAIDSTGPHQFTFTPSISVFVDCESEAEIDSLYAKLSEGGGVMMPLDNYGFSRKFAWVGDRYGVSWQLILA